ncbi:MAG: DUF4923 family protein [Bacteroidales bacterium]|nr:DUF4923 family protein [Bacteroidales bacterium]
MKTFVYSIMTAGALMCAPAASAFDPSELLNALKGDSTATTSSDSGKTGGILSTIGGVVGNVLANDKFTVDDLVGTWNYSSPAVSFKSDNALKNIGGAGAATAVEAKLEPYYTRLGFNKTTLTVAEDHSFTMKMGALSLSGTIEKDDSGNLWFNFSAFKKVSLGKVAAHATKAGNTLNLTFDATRMIELLTKVSSVLNSSSLNAVTSLLSSYDGIYMGFKLKR